MYSADSFVENKHCSDSDVCQREAYIVIHNLFVSLVVVEKRIFKSKALLLVVTF